MKARTEGTGVAMLFVFAFVLMMLANLPDVGAQQQAQQPTQQAATQAPAKEEQKAGEAKTEPAKLSEVQILTLTVKVGRAQKAQERATPAGAAKEIEALLASILQESQAALADLGQYMQGLQRPGCELRVDTTPPSYVQIPGDPIVCGSK